MWENIAHILHKNNCGDQQIEADIQDGFAYSSWSDNEIVVSEDLQGSFGQQCVTGPVGVILVSFA